jgi:hypothetical protein
VPSWPTVNPRVSSSTKSDDPRQPQFQIPRKVVKGGSRLCAPNYCLRYQSDVDSPHFPPCRTGFLRSHRSVWFNNVERVASERIGPGTVTASAVSTSITSPTGGSPSSRTGVTPRSAASTKAQAKRLAQSQAAGSDNDML